MVPVESDSSMLEQSSPQWEQMLYPPSPGESLWQPSVSDLIADTNETIQAQDEAASQRHYRTPPAEDNSTPIAVSCTTEGDHEHPDTYGASTSLIPTETIEVRKPCQKPTWRPFWLQRPILGAFSGFFFACAIALLSMLAYSERSQGLTIARMELANLWRFGPPAVLTIVSTLWARVEFQTLRYFPWMTINKDTKFSGHHITSLDYTSLILPKVILLSLKRKDFLVCLVSVLSILMKAQVVLSANLFYDKAVRYSLPLEIELLDTFQTSHELDFLIRDKTAYFAARAFYDFHMTLPFGITEQAAYQTFKPAGSDTVIRGTTDMPVTVTVDALFTDVQCLPMKEFESHVTRSENFSPTSNYTQSWYNFIFDILFEECDRPIRINAVNLSSPQIEIGEQGYWTSQTIKEMSTPCPSLPTQFPPFVYLGYLEKLSEKSKSIPVVKQCAAIICSPVAWVSKVEVHDDGIKPVLRLLSDKEVVKVNSNPWNLLANIITFIYGNNLIGDIGGPWEAGPLGADHMWLGMDDIRATDESLYQNERLIRAVQNLTKAFGPFASSYHLREKQKSSTVGSRIGTTQELHMNQRICIAMAVIFSLSGLTAIWVAIKAPRTLEACPRNPGTILGSAILFHGDSKFTSIVQEKIEAEEQQIPCQAWSDSLYSTLTLQSWFRGIFAIYTLGLIISAGTLLQISYHSDGIVTLAEGCPSLWWTSVPTIVTAMITWYSSSSDMAVRDLAILSELSSKATSISALDVSLSDMLGVRALYHSFRLKTSAISLSLILAILSGFLSPLSATLFASQAIPGMHDLLVKQTSWFGPASPPGGSTGSGTSEQMELSLWSILLNNQVNNFTYPEFTYGDLVFPSVEIAAPNVLWGLNNSIKVNVTAAKLVSDCSKLLPGEYNLTVPAELTLLSTDGKKLQMDYRHPPIPDLSMLKPYEPPLIIPSNFLEEFGVTSMPAHDGIDPIFNAIIEPSGSFPLESLAAPDQDVDLLEAINHQSGILAAQLISKQNRYSINGSSGSANIPTLKGTIVDNKRLRLVQNFPVTIAMIVILSLVLAFHTWGLVSTALRKALGGGRKWLLDLELKGVAPSGFSSIAMMNDLLCGSNIREKLQGGVDFMSAEDISMTFENVECRLGWFYNTRTEQQQYTVGIVERGEFEFINKGKS